MKRREEIVTSWSFVEAAMEQEETKADGQWALQFLFTHERLWSF